MKAYNLYLKGRHFWSQRTPEAIRKGIEYLEQATQDPSCALASAGLVVKLSKRAPFFVGLLGHIYGKSGMTKQVERLIAALTTRSTKEYVASFCFLTMYTGLGDKERIFEWLKKPHEQGVAPALLWGTLKPDLDSLSSESRFADLRRGVGLEP